ncbi:MAG: hypothetical protein N3A54_03805 [Patescibacteria group bacterium]|nr:hypothetical protein [Patescibacteria group bacterium]
MEVAKGTPIITKRGVIPIEEVKKYDEVWTEFGWIGVIDTEGPVNKKAYVVRTHNDFSIAVGDSQFFVSSFGSYDRKSVIHVSELYKGDKIGVLLGPSNEELEIVDKKYIFSSYKDRIQPIWLRETINEPLGYILGFLFGIVNVDSRTLIIKKNSLHVSIVPQHYNKIQVFLHSLQNFLGYEFCYIRDITKDGIKRKVISLYFRKDDEENGKDEKFSQTSAEKRLYFLLKKISFPEVSDESLQFILRQSANIRYSFVAGFYDAKFIFQKNILGGKKIWFFKSKSAASAFRFLLWSIGISTPKEYFLLSRKKEIRGYYLKFSGKKSFETFQKINNKIFGYYRRNDYSEIKICSRVSENDVLIYNKRAKKQKEEIMFGEHHSYVLCGGIPTNVSLVSTVEEIKKPEEQEGETEFYGIHLEVYNFCCCGGFCLMTSIY